MRKQNTYKLSEAEKELLYSTLEGIYDWTSSDLRRDFLQYISEHSDIDSHLAGLIFDTYDALDPRVRHDLEFDFDQFLKGIIRRERL